MKTPLGLAATFVALLATSVQLESTPALRGNTYLVASQADFSSALAAASPGDSIVFTASGEYTPTGHPVIDGLTIESQSPAWGVVNFSGVTNSARFRNCTLRDFAIRWLPGPATIPTVVLESSSADNVQMYYAFTGVSPWTRCEGNVSIRNGIDVALHVTPGAQVDFATSSFEAATSACDQGNLQIDPGGSLSVLSWWYGGKLYDLENLIVSYQIVWSRNCPAFIRIEVADPAAAIGSITYGDDACGTFTTGTTRIGNYHYAELTTHEFFDGDLWWSADVGYCADWGTATIDCKRAKASRGLMGCPEPWWWPY